MRARGKKRREERQEEEEKERQKPRQQMCDEREAAGEGRASCQGLGVSTRSVHSQRRAAGEQERRGEALSQLTHSLTHTLGLTHTRANWQNHNSKRFFRRQPTIGCSSPGLAEGAHTEGKWQI